MLNTLLLAHRTANVRNTFFPETLPKANLLKTKHCDMFLSSVPSCQLLHFIYNTMPACSLSLHFAIKVHMFCFSNV